jgi:hypothetical protein
MLQIIFSKVKTAATKLKWYQFSWLLLMYPLSGLIRASVLTIPFKYLNKALGSHHKNHQLCTLFTEQQITKARQIGQTIRIMSKYTPWKSNCMVEAILARMWLSWHKIPYVFYMGAYMTKDPAEPMKAHAWVTTGYLYVVGGRGHQKYAIVSTFLPKQFIQKSS